MIQVAATTVDNPLSQLVAQCRDQPVVYDGVRPDLCPALERAVIARMQGDRGRRIGSLNVGGWKSAEDFFTWPDDAVQDLRRAVVEIVGTSRPLVAWAMVNRAGSQHPRHQHRTAILVGVYYVTTGSPEAVTPTVFECPCDGRLTRPEDRHEVAVDPHPGRLAFCRGTTWHSVPKYAGDQPRVTIAFDVRR